MQYTEHCDNFRVRKRVEKRLVSIWNVSACRLRVNRNKKGARKLS